MTRAEALAACLKALNNAYIRPCERRLGIAWLATNKSRIEALLNRTLTVIAQRECDPKSLENWSAGQRVSRAGQKLHSDLSAPTRLWASDNQTTA
jgi:hypothetical protein